MPATARRSPKSNPTPQQFVEAHQQPTSEVYGIQALCSEFGTTLRAVRFYEAKGLLAPQRVNGARVYSRKDRARLALILRARDMGMSLAEIRTYLDLYGDHGEGRSQQLLYVIERTDAAIASLQAKRAHIDTTLKELRHINATCRAKLASRSESPDI